MTDLDQKAKVWEVGLGCYIGSMNVRLYVDDSWDNGDGLHSWAACGE